MFTALPNRARIGYWSKDMARQVKRISDLPEAGPIQGDELLEMVQGGENLRVRADQLGGDIAIADVQGLTEALDERVLDDDPRLSDSRVPTGGAGGVLSGQYPNPGFAVPMATAEALDGKVDKVEGKGLSTNDLTDPLYDKLIGLEGTHWRGTFVSLAALEAGVTDPAAGDYADVDVVGEDVQRYIWDATDSAWVAQSGEVAPITAAQVKLLYESNPDTNAFTDRKSTRLNSSHVRISYAVFCLKKKNKESENYTHSKTTMTICFTSLGLVRWSAECVALPEIVASQWLLPLIAIKRLRPGVPTRA